MPRRNDDQLRGVNSPEARPSGGSSSRGSLSGGSSSGGSSSRGSSSRGSSSRGAGWVAAQFVLLALVGFGPRTIGGVGAMALAPLWRMVGGTLIVAGAVVAVLGARWLGPNLTPFPLPRHDGSLVTTGPYAIVRHPIYAALLLAALGWTVVQGSILTLGYSAVLLMFFDRKARREERHLLARFPDYPAYQRRVRMLLPFVY